MSTSHLKTAKPLKDLDKSNLWALYGKSGSGKTTLASTFPKPALYIPIGDGGYGSIEDVEGIIAIPEVKNITMLEELIDELMLDNKYETVIVDTFGLVVNEWTEENVSSKKKKMSQQAWGDLKTDTESIIRKMKLLAKKKIVVLTLHEATDSIEGMEDEITPDIRPNVSRGARTYLEGMCNFGIHCTILQKEKTQDDGTVKLLRAHAVHLAPHPYYWVKTQKPASVVLPDVLRNPTYDKIIKAIQGGN
jgi:hypothetical protein